VFEESEGRVAGFLCEAVHGKATVEDDCSACQGALQALQDLQIIHEDLNKHNMIVSGGAVELIDFEESIYSSHAAPKWNEMERLIGAHSDTSGRGAPLSPVTPHYNCLTKLIIVVT
jgi:Ser/Thr protein kinase RdoA (MazF antagonist)